MGKGCLNPFSRQILRSDIDYLLQLDPVQVLIANQLLLQTPSHFDVRQHGDLENNHQNFCNFR